MAQNTKPRLTPLPPPRIVSRPTAKSRGHAHADLRIPLREMRQAVRPDRVYLFTRSEEGVLSQVQIHQCRAGLHVVLRQDGEEELVFERLRAALDAALAAATPGQDLRDLAGQMRNAVVELKAAVGKMREDLAHTERQLEVERRHRNDAERRGNLAEGIRDQETVTVARQFVTRHSERITVQEQKL